MILKTIHNLGDQQFQRNLKRIEREGNDDLLLIWEFGPREYSNQELHILLRTVNWQAEVAGRFQHRLFLVAASISLWIGSAFLAAAAGFNLLATFLLCLAPLALAVTIAGHIHLRKKYRAFRYSRDIAHMIQQELERRRKDASIF